MPSDNTTSSTLFSYRERLLVAPLPAGPTKQFFHTRMESKMSLTTTTTTTTTSGNDDIITPFPGRQVFDLLRNHNATQILIQVGTSSSHSFGGVGGGGGGNRPLDSIEPWVSNSSSSSSSSQQQQQQQKQRLDLGPSGVLVRATLRIEDESIARVYWESLLHELVAQRILLAPLFSMSIRRLHRHSTTTKTTSSSSSKERIFELILPTEGSSLSSEGMHALTTIFSPCYNQSGIFNWNSPHVMSEFFLKRQSSVRHSWWIQIEQHEEQEEQQQENKEMGKKQEYAESTRSSTTATKTTTTTTITKGMQFQPHIEATQNHQKGKKSISLTDLFPASTKHRRCPFVDETTLDVLKSASSYHDDDDDDDGISKNKNKNIVNNNLILDSKEFVPKYWKEPFLTLPSSSSSSSSTNIASPQWSIHQMLRRPRGVAYSGRLITQVVVTSPPPPPPTTTTTETETMMSDSCSLSVEIKWFLPPIVQPTWKSFRIIQEDTSQQQERLLDWRNDLQGSITVIDPTTTTTTNTTITRQQQQQSTSASTTNKDTMMIPFDDGTLYFHIPQWNVPTTTIVSTQQQQQQQQRQQQQISLTISLDYRPAFLSFEHFPGDANRGVEIPPAQAIFFYNCETITTTTTNNNNNNNVIHLYSNSLLLLPPVPDMSMPFNVLSMTCSLYAFVIGALLNLLIRKSSERIQQTYDPNKIPPPSKVRLLIGKIKKSIVEKIKTTTTRKNNQKEKKLDDEKDLISDLQAEQEEEEEEEEEKEETNLCKEKDE